MTSNLSSLVFPLISLIKKRHKKWWLVISWHNSKHVSHTLEFRIELLKVLFSYLIVPINVLLFSHFSSTSRFSASPYFYCILPIIVRAIICFLLIISIKSTSVSYGQCLIYHLNTLRKLTSVFLHGYNTLALQNIDFLHAFWHYTYDICFIHLLLTTKTVHPRKDWGKSWQHW